LYNNTNTDRNNNNNYQKVSGSLRIRKNLNIDTNTFSSNLNMNTNPYSNKNHADFLMLDSNKPLISPINFHPQMFPISTKNHFNINMDTQNNMQNYIDTPNNMKNYFNNFRFLNNYNYLDNLNYQTIPNLKEINMQNKILINEIDNLNENENENNKSNNNYINLDEENKSKKNDSHNKTDIYKDDENKSTPKFDMNMNMNKKDNDYNYNENILDENYLLENHPTTSIDMICKNENENGSIFILSESGKTIDKNSEKKMNLDLDIVNDSDTINIFSNKVKNSINNYHKFSFGNQNDDKNDVDDDNYNNKDNINFSEAEIKEGKKQNRISPFINLNLNLQLEDNNKENNINNNNYICKSPQENIKIPLQQNFQSPNFFEKNRFLIINNNNNNDNNVLLKTPKMSEGKNENFLEPVNNSIKKEFLNKLNFFPIISPSRASLNISPKSAFVINRKLFN
jgi:hypothetical protein